MGRTIWASTGGLGKEVEILCHPLSADGREPPIVFTLNNLSD
jgi:hypothetical protein